GALRNSWSRGQSGRDEQLGRSPGRAAKVGVEHGGDVAWALAGGGHGIADQAACAETKQGCVETELANSADQLHRALRIRSGTAKYDRGWVEGAKCARQPLFAKLIGED